MKGNTLFILLAYILWPCMPLEFVWSLDGESAVRGSTSKIRVVNKSFRVSSHNSSGVLDCPQIFSARYVHILCLLSVYLSVYKIV